MGGAGGGAIEIRANGRLTANGSYVSTGASGLSPQADGANSGGSVGEAVGADGPGKNGRSWRGGYGGAGTFVAGVPGEFGTSGGHGGAGGSGSAGGGGAGGTIKLFASVVQTTGVIVDTSGGAGGNAGGNGRFIVGSNTPVDLSSSLIAGAGVEQHAGAVDTNPFIKNGLETPFIPGLTGGPEVYGRLNGLDARSREMLPYLTGVPAGAASALLRLPDGPGAYADPIPGFDMLLLINLTAAALANPALGVDPSGLDLTFVQALLVRGPDRNPFFQGAGAQLLGSLPGYEIFATLIPEHGTIFNLGYNGHEISGLDLQIGHVLYLDRQAALVPESSTLALFVAGIGVLLGIFRSKRLFPCRSIRINGLRHH